MHIFSDFNGALHRIRVKLYPGHLPGSEGTYYARTANEALLTIDQICETMKKRAGYPDSYDHLADDFRHILDEVAYQLCDGYGVNLGYFSIHPNVGGMFRSIREVYDCRKNPVNFKFSVLKPLSDLARHIAVDIIGLADGNAFIDEFVDTDEQSTNSLFLPGDIFSISGSKIKVDGGSPDCGVFFVPIDDPAKAVRVARIGENSPSKIVGIAPDTGHIRNRIEIRTQFTGSGTLLKNPRIIASSFILEAA